MSDHDIAKAEAHRLTIDRLEAENRELRQVVAQQSARLEKQARQLAAVRGEIESHKTEGQWYCDCCENIRWGYLRAALHGGAGDE